MCQSKIVYNITVLISLQVQVGTWSGNWTRWFASDHPDTGVLLLLLLCNMLAVLA